jgi:hypothetical protein
MNLRTLRDAPGKGMLAAASANDEDIQAVMTFRRR